ncbi:unnamed protein product [Effrenium voratum]|uniref:Uncharacterized protein n=1 Tax=Effrenium voratum TaxID=2562239 RepID=A0AA36HY02_9DINO|nr:unnamed protein product [Effrenium voratum]
MQMSSVAWPSGVARSQSVLPGNWLSGTAGRTCEVSLLSSRGLFFEDAWSALTASAVTAPRQVDLPGQQRRGATYLPFFGHLSAFLTLRQMQLQPLRGLPPAIQTLSGMQDLRTHESCSTCARVRCSKRLRRNTFSSSTPLHKRVAFLPGAARICTGSNSALCDQ